MGLSRPAGSLGDDALDLVAPLASRHLKGDPLPLFERLIPFGLNGGVVDQYSTVAIALNKTLAFAVVKPLNCTGARSSSDNGNPGKKTKKPPAQLLRRS